MKHFEHLWDDAEKAKGQPVTRKDTLSKVRELLGRYEAAEAQSTPVGYTAAAKHKAMGDLLLLLANLSAMDMIDVYRALSEAIERSNIRSLGISNEPNESSDS